MPSFETALLLAIGFFCVGSWVLMALYKRFHEWLKQRRVRREIARTARFRNRLYVADLQRAHLHAAVGQRRQS